MKKTITLYTLP